MSGCAVRRSVVLAACGAFLPPLPPRAIAAESSAYDNYASSYDVLDGGVLADALGLAQLRAEATSLCAGRVLEVGVGTGLNLPLYDARRCEQLIAIDLSAGMLHEAATAAKAARGRSLAVELRQMNAEALDR